MMKGRLMTCTGDFTLTVHAPIKTTGVTRETAAPNEMWKKRPRGQLEKCAEAAALRAAFPEELGNDYAAEEMAGQIVDHVPTSRRWLTRPIAPTRRTRLDEA
jgi:hypothetical protein